MIAAVANHGRLCFFDSAFAGPKGWFTLAKRDRRTLDLVRANPGIMERDLAHHLRLTQSAVSKRLHRLRSEGWVRSLRVGLTVRWQALR